MEAEAKPERLFFALWPSPALQGQLAALRAAVLPTQRNGWRARTHSAHLTLAFLGMLDAATRACVERRADALRVPAFELQLDGLGCFRRRGLLWASASIVPPPLRTLVEALHALQTDCGLTPETRPFLAHVTLARHLRRCPPEHTMASIFWPVREFMLLRSEAGAGGARYSVLRTWTLG